jgi:hypothetical protein
MGKSGLVKHSFRANLLVGVLQGTAKSNCLKEEGSLRMSGGGRWEERISCWIEAAVAWSVGGLGVVGFGFGG